MGEQFVAPQPPARTSRRAKSADVDRDASRSWLSHGFAALGISALGLAVAGSVALTTSAETTHAASDGIRTAQIAHPAAAPAANESPKPPSGAAKAFTPRAAEAGTRSAAVRKAIVREQAAQRAEELAKSAEDVSKADRVAAADARQKTLIEANEASRETAAKLVQESLRRTAAARVAAASDRQAAESSASASTTTSSSIPTGGRGASPVSGAVIGAHFGQYGMWSRYHTGLDFRASYGTPIHAVMAGVVLYAGNSGDWAGIHVAVKHADGRTTMYSHMSSMSARVGQVVQAGQVIGYVGQTGRAFGAHLHFELYPVGVKYGDVYKAVNPGPWLAANGVQTH
jgi:murein DD-endopeptidase MepM/ murein hydrolase activator NlpD